LKQLPRILPKFKNSKSLVGIISRNVVMDTSICTSTAYKCCQTHFICLPLMWDQSGLGLQP
jgi:hypothetical protein